MCDTSSGGGCCCLCFWNIPTTSAIKKKKKAMFLRVSNLVKVSRHSTGEPGDMALMACEMQEDRQNVESLLDLHFPSASSVD